MYKTDIDLQTELVKNVCTGFFYWCKDNGTNLYRELNQKGKVSRSCIYKVMKGERNYIPLKALGYLASKTNLSIAELAQYKPKKV
jgi:hypothetical protein